jgi:hypothetical protein
VGAAKVGAAKVGAFKPANNLTAPKGEPTGGSKQRAVTRANKAVKPDADDRVAVMERKMKEMAEQLKQAKADAQKPAEKKRTAALLAAEMEEVKAMKEAEEKEAQENVTGVEELTPGSTGSKIKPVMPKDSSIRNMDLKPHLKVNGTVVLTWGAKKEMMGDIVSIATDGKASVLMDNGELIQATLFGKGALKHVTPVPAKDVPCDMLRFKLSAVIEMLVHPSRAQKAEAPESLESMGSAWSIVESLDFMEDKKKAKWVLALGSVNKVFVATLGTQMPLPGDYCCVVKTDKSSNIRSVLAQKVHLGGCYSFDQLTKKILIDSGKTISVRVGLADYNKAIRVHDPKTSRKWVQTESIESAHVPLDIRSFSHDISETKEEVSQHVACDQPARVRPTAQHVAVRALFARELTPARVIAPRAQKYELLYIPCEQSKDLQKIIGVDAYMEVVRSTSAHPLLADLVEANAPLLLGQADIIFSLRKIAEDIMSSEAREMLTTNVFTNAVRSIAYPISAKYTDQVAVGISGKEEKQAMALYQKTCNKVFSMLSPGTTELAKTMPRFRPSGKMKTVETIMNNCKRTLTPTLPEVKSGRAANQKDKEKAEEAEEDVEEEEEVTPPPKVVKPMEKKMTRAGTKASGEPVAQGASRKSGLGLKGSPKKDESDDEEELRVRKKISPQALEMPKKPSPTSSPEVNSVAMDLVAESEKMDKLAGAMSALPGVTEKLDAVVKSLQDKTQEFHAKESAEMLELKRISRAHEETIANLRQQVSDLQGQVRIQSHLIPVLPCASSLFLTRESPHSPSPTRARAPSPSRACVPACCVSLAPSHTRRLLPLSHHHLRVRPVQVNELNNEKMAQAVSAARAEGRADQLVLQLEQQTAQLNSWVRATFLEHMVEADYDLCDNAGSLIP